MLESQNHSGAFSEYPGRPTNMFWLFLRLFVFDHFFHKNGDISSSCRQTSLRSFKFEAFCIHIQILKTRGLGNFCSSRTAGTKVGKIRPKSWKSAIWWEISQFFGPCRGLTHPEGCIRQGGKRKSVSRSFYYSEGNFLLLEKSWLLIVVILFNARALNGQGFLGDILWSERARIAIHCFDTDVLKISKVCGWLEWSRQMRSKQALHMSLKERHSSMC